jgi:hypothetical protein
MKQPVGWLPLEMVFMGLFGDAPKRTAGRPLVVSRRVLQEL